MAKRIVLYVEDTMRKILLLMLLLGCLSITGCAVKKQKDWAATGGSRADATVELSYEYTDIEIPVTNDAEGLRIAQTRCQSWGYDGAEPFGGIKRTMNGPGSWLVTKTFQCLGQGVETPTRK